MKQWIAAALMLACTGARAQDSSGQKSALTFSGYAEAYYSYDFNRPANNSRPAFLYNYDRHNEVNLNLGYVRGAYSTGRVRANLAVAVGTYMNTNYAAEPGTLKNIYEANAGYKLSASKNWWLDVGILPSHIGFESATGKDNWTLTRSIAAENSPYFESGGRLSYATGDGKFSVAALALNGWQRITRPEGNSLLSWGTQVNFKPSEKTNLNYSTFLGSDKPDTARRWRYFHDVYGIFQINSLIGLTFGFDIGMEQKAEHSNALNTWYTPVGILRITPSSKWALALRGEYYHDPHSVIIATGILHGFQTAGASLNLDYLPIKNAVLRLEARTLNSRDPVFPKGAGTSDANTAVTFAMAVGF